MSISASDLSQEVFTQALTQALTPLQPEKQSDSQSGAKISFEDVVFTVTINKASLDPSKKYTVTAKKKSWFSKILTKISDFFAQRIYDISSLFSHAEKPEEKRKKVIQARFKEICSSQTPSGPFRIEGRDVSSICEDAQPTLQATQKVASKVFLNAQPPPQDSNVQSTNPQSLSTEEQKQIEQESDRRWTSYMHGVQDLLEAFGNQHRIDRLRNLTAATKEKSSTGFYPEVPKEVGEGQRITFEDFFNRFIDFRETSTSQLEEPLKSRVRLNLTHRFNSTFQFLCTYDSGLLTSQAESIFQPIEQGWATFDAKDKEAFIALLDAVHQQLSSEAIKSDPVANRLKEQFATFIRQHQPEVQTEVAPLPLIQRITNYAAGFFNTQNILTIAPYVLTGYFFGLPMAATLAVGMITSSYATSIGEKIASYFPARTQPLIVATTEVVLPTLASAAFYRAINLAFPQQSCTHLAQQANSTTEKVSTVATTTLQQQETIAPAASDVAATFTAEPLNPIPMATEQAAMPSITLADCGIDYTAQKAEVDRVIKQYDEYTKLLISGLKKYAKSLNIDLE